MNKPCKHSLKIMISKRGEKPKRFWCTSCDLKFTKKEEGKVN